MRRCAHLEALAQAAVGLVLTPGAELVAAPRSRGRFGSALQWHLGLEPHDGLAELDWEDRIEIKLVSVWRRGDGVRCDKLKVCDAQIDPWRKLSNVLWVFADRLTRVVVGTRRWTLAGPAREALERSWGMDPHFDRPELFVESRDRGDHSAPAYYVAAAWLARAGILPPAGPGLFPFDAQFWGEARARAHAHGVRDPLATVVAPDSPSEVRCPRCAGTLAFDSGRLRADDWAPAHHRMPLGPACAVRGHYVVNRAHLIASWADAEAAIEGRVPPHEASRLSDRVPEPEDHLH